MGFGSMASFLTGAASDLEPAFQDQSLSLAESAVFSKYSHRYQALTDVEKWMMRAAFQ